MLTDRMPADHETICLYREARRSPLDFVIGTITDWLERNRQAMNIFNGKRIENEDFTTYAAYNESVVLIC
jgi:hypothetical protein